MSKGMKIMLIIAGVLVLVIVGVIDRKVTANRVVKDVMPQVQVKDINREENLENEEDTKEVEGIDYILYTVQEGETLRQISYKHYHTELRTKEIIKFNEIENGDEIYSGMKLKLPID